MKQSMRSILERAETYLQSLTEAPYKMNGSLVLPSAGKMSLDCLNNSYQKIGHMKDFGHSFSLYKAKGNGKLKQIRILDDAIETIQGVKRCRVAGYINFDEYPVEIKGISKLLQIDKSWIDDEYQNLGVGAKVYFEICKMGYTIVSDSTQYEPGVRLWKKLARESSQLGMKVNIYNRDTGKFLEKNGKPIQYNGSNIPDTEIWSEKYDFTKESILLVLSR